MPSTDKALRGTIAALEAELVRREADRVWQAELNRRALVSYPLSPPSPRSQQERAAWRISMLKAGQAALS